MIKAYVDPQLFHQQLKVVFIFLLNKLYLIWVSIFNLTSISVNNNLHGCVKNNQYLHQSIE